MSQQIVSTWDGVANTNSWVHDGGVERSAVDIVELASSVAGYSAGAQAAADAASGYADTASAAVASIGTAATDAVQAVQDEGAAQISALVDAGGVQSALIGSAGAAQIADIVTSGGVVTSAIADAGNAEIADIVSAGGAQVALVSAAGTSATGDLAAVTAAQSAALVSAGGYQAGLVASAGTATIALVQAEGATQTAAISASVASQVNIATSAAIVATSAATVASSTVSALTSAGSAQIALVNSAGAAQSAALVSAGGVQVSLVESAGATQSSLVVSTGAAQSALVVSTGATQSAAVTSAGGVQITSIGSAGAAQISAITSAGGVQVTSVGSAGQTQIDAITSAGAVYQAQIDALDVKTDITDKRVDNIAALLNGALSTTQTEATAAYAKTVPAKAQPYAAVESIGGKTMCWNQLVDTGTSSVTLTSGHKYYTLVSGTASIVTGSGAAISVTGGTDKVCDLTLMFGAGNEPSTVAEFQQMFPTIEPAYNAGQLISAGVTGAVSRGRNLCDIPDGDYTASQTNHFGAEDGLVTVSGATQATSNADAVYIKTWERFANYGTSTVISEANSFLLYPGIYTLSIQNVSGNFANGSIYVWGIVGSIGDTYQTGVKYFYKTVSSNNLTETFTITSPQRIAISIQKEAATAQTNVSFNIQIEEGSTVTPYTPYHAPITLPIPAAVQALPGYGWSAGSVCNYIDWERKVYVQNVGAVDMGTQTYSYNAFYGFYSRAEAIGIKLSNGNSVKGNIVSPMYENMTYNDIGSYHKDMGIAIGTGIYWLVSNNAYSDPTTFKTAMSGVYFYYELATPIETDISAYLSDDNLIEVEPGGTVTFPSQLGDDYRIPVPSTEEYTIDLAPDTPSTDGTYTLQCVVSDGVATYSWVSA